MPASPVRLCMIGAGAHASSQLYPLFPRLRAATVVAACDLDAQRVADVAGRFAITSTYVDWRRMIAEQGPDACLVCINDVMHAKLAIDLMRAGLHVFVEKPHAPTLEASLEMETVATACDRICMGAYKKRFAPAYLHARESWLAPDFGDICHIGCYRGVGASEKQDSRHLWQWGCHIFDLLHWIGGPVETVHALRNASDWRSVCATLSYASGAVGTLTLAAPGGNWEGITVLGRKGHAVKVEDGWRCTVFDGNDPCGGYTPSFAASGDGAALMGFLGELQAFVDAIHSGERPDGHITDLHHGIALHEAVLRSIASRAVERVDGAQPPKQHDFSSRQRRHQQ